MAAYGLDLSYDGLRQRLRDLIYIDLMLKFVGTVEYAHERNDASCEWLKMEFRLAYSLVSRR